MLLPKQVWTCDIVRLQVQATALDKHATTCFPNTVKVLQLASVPHCFDPQKLQSLCFIVRANCDAIQTWKYSTCKVAIATVTTSCVSFHAVGDSSPLLYLEHVRVDKKNIRQSQVHTRQSMPTPKLHLTVQPRAHKTTDRFSTVQAWQLNQTEINTVHFTCQILCLYIPPEDPTMSQLCSSCVWAPTHLLKPAQQHSA